MVHNEKESLVTDQQEDQELNGEQSAEGNGEESQEESQAETTEDEGQEGEGQGGIQLEGKASSDYGVQTEDQLKKTIRVLEKRNQDKDDYIKSLQEDLSQANDLNQELKTQIGQLVKFFEIPTDNSEALNAAYDQIKGSIPQVTEKLKTFDQRQVESKERAAQRKLTSVLHQFDVTDEEVKAVEEALNSDGYTYQGIIETPSVMLKSYVKAVLEDTGRSIKASGAKSVDDNESVKSLRELIEAQQAQIQKLSELMESGKGEPVRRKAAPISTKKPSGSSKVSMNKNNDGRFVITGDSKV